MINPQQKGMAVARKYITTSVPTAGKLLFDLSPWGAYEAAKRGDIQVIQVGRKKRVPVVWMEQVAGVGAGDLDGIIDTVEA
jgi:hypothetical protein